jgi:ABC-type nitrate/sulfonate/bicarbonate transport system substrate-binding protein
MDKIAFPFRSSTHLPLLHVIAESGSWEKYGLDVTYNERISAGHAHDAVMSGDVEFVGGNHISPYGHRARGDKWVYLGQTVNDVPGRKLVVRQDSGIERIEDLREKVVGARGSHPKLNDWLQLKQHGLDTDKDEVAVIDQYRKDDGSEPFDPANVNAEDDTEAVWKWIRDKKIDAAFLQVPQWNFAAEAGLKIIDLDPFPMIYFTTISTSSFFAEKHPDIVDRFLKGLLEGIHFFKTQPERTMKVLRAKYTNDGQMDEAITKLTYDALAKSLEPKLVPTMKAISNVYEQGIREDKDALRVNPMELWDLHYIRNIADSGFIDKLYGGNPSLK